MNSLSNGYTNQINTEAVKYLYQELDSLTAQALITGMQNSSIGVDWLPKILNSKLSAVDVLEILRLLSCKPKEFLIVAAHPKFESLLNPNLLIWIIYSIRKISKILKISPKNG